MSGGAADNEAKVVITADASQFAKFMSDFIGEFRRAESEGKKSLKSIDGETTKLLDTIKGLGKSALSGLMNTATAPLRQAFSGALQAARRWRQESTRIMGATGEDWRKIGGQIDDLSRRTGRMPDDVAHYADAVREITGSWNRAGQGAEEYSDLARYMGRQSVSQMAP